MKVPRGEGLGGYRPPVDVAIGFRKFCQDRLKIKSLGELKLAGGGSDIQLDDLDFLELGQCASDRSGTTASRHAGQMERYQSGVGESGRFGTLL